MKTTPTVKKYTFWLLGIFVLLAVFFLLPQAGTFKETVVSITTADPFTVFLGIIAIFLTYPAAAISIIVLAYKKLFFLRTLYVQLSSGFAGKLVPAGIGGFALNTRYLNKQKHTVVQASAVMSLNGLLGFIGHACIIFTALLLASYQLGQTLTVIVPAWFIRVVLVAGLAGLTSVIILQPVRSLLKRYIRDILLISRYYYKKPAKLVYGFVGASAVTLLFSVALYFSAFALGVTLNPLQVLFAYTAVAVGIAITPTPGGVGGAEAALTGALVAIGIETNQAFAIALLYRLISYWLPIVPGFVMFQICLKRGFI